MNSLVMEIVKVVGAIVGLATAAFVTYWKIRQDQAAKEHGLEPNPERCGRHEEAIRTLKEDLRAIEDANDRDHDRIFRELGTISVEIAKLSRNGSGGGAR